MTCLNDDHCATGACHPRRRVCVACLSHADCEADTFCVGAECVPGGRCARVEDCADGLACDEESGLCVDCLRDGHCDRGLLCEERVCVPGCNQDADCPGERPRCLPGGDGCVQCLEAADCGDEGGAGFVCHNGACAPLCEGDDDCEGDGVCDQATGDCVECRDDDACPIGRICQAGACVEGCRDPRDCPDGGACSAEGECVDCDGDRDCPVGSDPYFVCDGGACRPGCRANAHCGGGLTCDVELATCQGCEADAECPGPLDRCLDGVCWPGCAADADCDGSRTGPRCGRAGLCVQCLSAADCGGGLCTDGRCLRCDDNDDDACPDGAFCEWLTDLCKPVPHAEARGLQCASCGDDDHCADGHVCVRRSDGTERFCSAQCGAESVCPEGLSCLRVGNAGFSCIPAGLYRWGTTCAAHRTLASRCGSYDDCGASAESLCREGVCTLPCTAADARRVDCPAGYECVPGFEGSPAPDGGACSADP